MSESLISQVEDSWFDVALSDSSVAKKAREDHPLFGFYTQFWGKPPPIPKGTIWDLKHVDWDALGNTQGQFMILEQYSYIISRIKAVQCVGKRGVAIVGDPGIGVY